MVTRKVGLSQARLLGAAAALAVLVLLGPFDPLLKSVGLNVVSLSVLAFFTALFGFNISRKNNLTVEPWVAVLLLTVLLMFLGGILFAISDRWVQHIVSLYWALCAVLALLYSFAGEDALRRSGLGFQNWQTGKVNAARWQALFCLAQCIANEILMDVLSPHAWVVFFALAPVCFQYLYHLTVIATHPYEDDDGG